MYANQQKLTIHQIGTKCDVPEAPLAKIMYYLGCVDSLTDFNIPSRLTNYENYSQLTYDEENQVLCLAVLLSPDEFIKKSIMVNEPQLCGDYNNDFYEINDIRTSVAATREFIIGGKRVRTLKIMAFKMSWLRSNYIEPIENYTKRIRAIADGNPDKYKKKKKECNIC